MARFAGSAAYRIAFATAGAFTLGILILGASVYFAAHGLFVQQFAGEITNESTTLVAEFRGGGRPELRHEIAEREAGNSANELLYALYAPDGSRIAGGMDAVMPRTGWSDIVFLDPREGPDPAMAYAVDLDDGTRFVVAADYSAIDRIDHMIFSLFATAFAVVVLFGIFGALLLGGYLQRRLSGIRDAAEAIMAGDMRQRVAVGEGRDEFDSLAITLNSMLDRIGSLMDNLRQVSADVAHDLRTPLTRLRSRLEEGLASTGTGPEEGSLLEDAVDRLDDILQLFAAILRISELEGGSATRAFAPVDLSELTRDLCESYAPAAAEGGRRLDWSVEPDIEVLGDFELLSQVLVNLFDNALIHTPPGTSVGVRLAREGSSACLQVRDDGPGVRAQDLQRIFKRFTRLEASRTKPGHGLGLSLVEAIVRAHGARLEVDDAKPGLSVSIRIALYRPQHRPGQVGKQ